jgi:alpha-acetolactate decarboxylase
MCYALDTVLFRDKETKFSIMIFFIQKICFTLINKTKNKQFAKQNNSYINKMSIDHRRKRQKKADAKLFTSIHLKSLITKQKI